MLKNGMKFPHICKKKIKVLKKEWNKLFFEKGGIIKFKATFVTDCENKSIKAEHFEGLTKGLIPCGDLKKHQKELKWLPSINCITRFL